MSLLTESEKQGIRADLLLTAIQSIEYVVHGNVMCADIAKKHNIGKDFVRTMLYEECRTLCEPMWAEYRTLKNPPKELQTSDFWDFIRETAMNVEPKDMNPDQQIKVAFDTTESAVLTYREYQEEGERQDGINMVEK